MCVNLDKVRLGDPDAFRDFFERMYPKLMVWACHFVDESVAKDLVQELFALYWEQKQTIDVENVESYLYKWLRNNCLNHLKHQAVVSEYEAKIRIDEARTAFLREHTDTNEVMKQVVDKDILAVIEGAVGKLPPKCAQAFRLCYFHDMPHKEIAEIMDISPRTVEGHIRQAMTFLRTDLRDLLN
ncbi:MAG: RNA polymerase sigma-70 factor [Tannerellaceae bacterium]